MLIAAINFFNNSNVRVPTNYAKWWLIKFLLFLNNHKSSYGFETDSL
ncbi:hypothetical protein LEP1GSC013_1937 [Leptospira interrogans serovar Valbuzzi str. Duyster]|nr:hypothetical protein LEP1GSC013_1937 [Leptospira interrogans serovar Valbuzzi str. Duyster]ENO73656.1 hypothetical protein LEP1GSC012_3572 [Leptospira interrogans serovar Valbuzzi str. Valbuzzi]